MKLIGSRWRERVGKPGLIKNEQRVVRTLFGLWIVSGLAVSFSDSALLCRSWSINSSSASLAITAVWSLPITPLSVLRMIYPCEIHGYYTV
ncbi:Uncharacterised protein [Klebsiella pneumoniae]|nr:Uncharacterised protein [Klebsiella pneumoniae]